MGESVPHINDLEMFASSYREWRKKFIPIHKTN